MSEEDIRNWVPECYIGKCTMHKRDTSIYACCSKFERGDFILVEGYEDARGCVPCKHWIAPWEADGD